MNAYPYIKNIDHEKVLKIADQVNADADQVVSKTLAKMTLSVLHSLLFPKEKIFLLMTRSEMQW